jgi:hypothetical protein
MNVPDLSHEDALRIFQSCLWLRLSDNSSLSPLLLKEFIACRLAPKAPELASKVRRLTGPELETLRADLKEQQCLADHLLFG